MNKLEVECGTCGRTVVVLDGVKSEHRNPKTHHRCKGSSQPVEEEKAQSAS